MKIDAGAARQLLQKFDFKTLFREQLGWDNYSTEFPLQLDGTEYRLSGIAHKRGFAVYLSDELPDSANRLKIYRYAAKATHEQLIIFADRTLGTQVWHWERREGATIAPREERYDTAKSGDALIQKLEFLAVSIEDEEDLTLPDVKARAKVAFDKERVTKRFYDTFKNEHKDFMAFIRGIKAAGDLEWYTSLMMNRMMFIYFIQKKGFLDGDLDYLRHRLRLVQERRGRDKFQTFYRYFLLRLFHEGLGSSERNLELDALLGKVPYLNGGFFEVHELERKYEIEIPDTAFEELFTFFDAWEWTLDDRPLRKDNEINPDVVGYIFEKYINQKQMGAYYTKEDITEYISKNTVLPQLFDVAKKDCAVAFRSDGLLWRMLQANPDRYIYEPVRRGVIDDNGQVTVLPPEIEAGIDDVSKRGGWNRPAAAAFALPTETWREHVARRKRCLEIRTKLAAGEVHEINDLITLNLDFWQFARDALNNAEGPELLRAFWHSLQKLTVLDPACGSGAFLFAALRILETLYGACIQRMRQFLDDLERSGEKHRPEKFKDFRQVLAQIERHPNESYYVLKSIIVGNLFGVDIMEEAVEICKLRLFLKLAAQVQTVDDIEPLPDIDFNIRAGNSLVGFTSLDAVRDAMTVEGAQGRLLSLTDSAKKTLRRIEEEAEKADRQFQLFREMQTEHDMHPSEFASAKAKLRERLDGLRLELDSYLARESGVDGSDTASLAKWRASHQPFHWLVEFYGIISGGGFDAIIGNPPYVEVPKVISRRLLVTYRSALENWSRDEDLYTFFVERSLHVSARNAGFGMILPLSLAFSTKRPFVALREFMSEEVGTWWWSHFDRIPSALFGNEVRTRSTIAILSRRQSPGSDKCEAHTTSLLRWETERRDCLFPLQSYSEIPPAIGVGVPKVGSQLQADVLTALTVKRVTLAADLQSAVSFRELAAMAPNFPKNCVFVGGTAYNWLPAWRTIPKTTTETGQASLPARTIGYRFSESASVDIVFALLCSSLGYWWWAVASDGFNLKRWLIERFPISASSLSVTCRTRLAELGKALQEELKKQYVYKQNKGQIGNFYLPACAAHVLAIDKCLSELAPPLSATFFDDIRGFNSSFSRADGESGSSNAEDE
jgi:hypothetical protein